MSFGIKEDCNGEEEIQARRDRSEATAGRCPSLARSEHGRRDPPDWGERGRLRDELLNGEIFYTLREAQIIIESWRRHYNSIRPHASLGYKPPAPEVLVPAFSAWPAAPHRRAPPATLVSAPA